MSFSRLAPSSLRAMRPAVGVSAFSSLSSRPASLSSSLVLRSFPSSCSSVRAFSSHADGPIVVPEPKPEVFATGNQNKPVHPFRPVSPHVTVYKFPIAALSSISNRVAGVALAGVFYVVGLSGYYEVDLFTLLNSYKDCVYVQAATPLVKLAIAFPVAYHSLAGARHMFWDKTARELDLPSVFKSSSALFAGAAVVAVGASFISLKATTAKPFAEKKK